MYAGFRGSRLLQLNANTGALIDTVPLAFNVYGLAISRTGNVLAISTTRGATATLVLLDATSLRQTGQIAVEAGACPGPVALDSGGTYAYAILGKSGCFSSAGTRIQKIDIRGLQLLGSIATGSHANGVLLSGSGATLYVAELNSVAAFSAKTLGLLERFAQPGIVSGIALSPAGTQVYAANSTSSGAQYAAEGAFASGEILPVGPTSPILQAAVTSSDGLVSFVNSGSATTITVIDNQSKKILRYLATEISPGIIAIGSSSGPLFAASRSASRLAELDMTTGAVIRQVSLIDFPAMMAVSPDNSQLWLAGLNSESVTVYDTKTLARIGAFPAMSPSTFTFSSDSQHCYVGSAQNNMPILDVNTQTLITNRTLAASLSVTFWLGLSPDGQTLYALASESIYAIRLLDGSIVSSVYVGFNPNMATLTSDGSEIYIGEKSGYLVIYDTASATVVKSALFMTAINGLSATPF